MDEAERRAAAALDSQEQAAEPAAAPRPAPTGPNLLQLQLEGGPLMIPIGILSLVVVAFGFERALALRRGRTFPQGLIEDLGTMAEDQGGLDPRKAYRVCQKYPSPAATVVRAALLKVGRPQSEIEQAVRDASEREAAKLYANVRPLTLSVAIAPLLGLLGTVQGMIEAFHQTASGLGGGNRAAELAGGIYLALITTFAGLCVAIPASVLAHYFEGRIQKLFLDVDEMLLGVLPQLERFEGKLRVGRSDGTDAASAKEKEKSKHHAAASAE
jgi:biopolymer transport protein ExbB